MENEPDEMSDEDIKTVCEFLSRNYKGGVLSLDELAKGIEIAARKNNMMAVSSLSGSVLTLYKTISGKDYQIYLN